MDPSQNPAILILSALLPLLISLVKQSGLPQQANALIALVAYVVVGAIGAYIANGSQIPTAETLVSFIATTTVVGTVAYNLVWSNLGKTTESDKSIDDRLTEATSVSK